MNKSTQPSVLYDMLHSLVTLGESQNLAATVEKLGISRQTVRRHIKELELHRNQVFFETSGGGYRLTQDGYIAVQEAKTLCVYSTNWLRNRISSNSSMSNIEFVLNESTWIYTQKQKLVDINSKATPILKSGFFCWLKSEGMLGSVEFDKIRPYMLVFRKYRNEWLAVHVGGKSAYATWLGVGLAKSEIGQKLDLGEQLETAVENWKLSYDIVNETGNPYYEHLRISMPRFIGEKSVPVNYQRLLVPCNFHDGKPAVAVFSARTDEINVPNIPKNRILPNLTENLMEYELPD